MSGGAGPVVHGLVTALVGAITVFVVAVTGPRIPVPDFEAPSTSENGSVR